MDFGFRILDFGFTERFGFCIRLFYYTPTRVGGFVAKISMKYAKIDTLENVFGGNHFVGWVVAFCSDLLRVFYKWKSVCRPGMTGPINFFWISLDRGATFLRMAGLRAGIHQNVLRVLDSWGRTRIYLYRFERGTIPVAHTHTHTHTCACTCKQTQVIVALGGDTAGHLQRIGQHPRHRRTAGCHRLLSRKQKETPTKIHELCTENVYPKI